MLNKLRPYQLEMVDKATSVRFFLCADDMGLGKTFEGMGIDYVRRTQERKYNKTLVIAPLTGVVDSWVRHFQEHTTLSVHRIDTRSKDKREQSFAAFKADPQPSVFVMHWQAVTLLKDHLNSVKWLHIIADESHKLKNRKNKWTKSLKFIKSVKYKTALTGTPVVNRPDELWSQLNWLFNSKRDQREYFAPEESQLLNSYWAFWEMFVEYEEDWNGYTTVLGPKNVDYLMAIMEDFYIRRTKKVALPGLADKQYTARYVDLLPGQQRMYDEMKAELLAFTDDDQPIVAPVVIAQLMRLQQMALATATVEEDGTINLDSPSSKIDALLDILQEAGDQKVVVFSQFSKMIDLVEQVLDKKGIETLKLTGSVKQADRSEIIARFQHDENSPKVFLATIGAGGTGIDLFAATTAIFLDRSWSPADNSQAEDRLHRSGQTGQVQIIDIMADGTIDGGKDQKLKLKASWIKEIIG